MRIKHIIYILLLVFTLVPLYVFGFFIIYENDKKVEGIMRENLAAISGTQILDIKNFSEARREKLEMLANYDMVHDSICDSLDSSNQYDKSYLNNLLLEWKSYSKFVESISLIDKNFNVVASSNFYEASEKSNLQYAKEKYLSGGFYFSNVLERETYLGTKKVIAAYQGVFEGDELLGYVVEEISLEFFGKNREDTNLWKDGTFYLIDGNNEIITAGDSDESREEFVTTKEERGEYVTAWNEVDLENEPSGEINYQIGDDDYVTYYSTIDDTEWIMMVTVNMSAYMGKNKTFGVLLIISVTMVSILLLVLNFFLANRLTYSIANIAGTLRQVQERKDYSLRIEKFGKDEIGTLAANINELLDYIEQENIEEKRRQRYLERKAERDSLTGLWNKRAIEERLQDMLQRAGEQGKQIAVGFVDIDDFKDYNTKFGHQEGDHVLQFVASVLDKYADGLAGRNGGDEFVFGLEHVRDAKEVNQRIEKVYKRLNEGLRLKESGETMPVPCSIGVVVAEGRHLSYSYLLECADEAMYEAKHSGKNNFKMKQQALNESDEI